MKRLNSHQWRLSVGIAAAFLALFVLWVATEIGGAEGTKVFDDLTLTVVPAGVGLLCFRAASQRHSRAKLAWRLWAAAMASWAVGQAIWSFYELGLHRDVPFPSLADVGYMAMYLFAAAGFAVFPSSTRTASRIRAAGDGLLVSGSVLYVGWSAVVEPVLRSSPSGTLAHVLGAVYPLADVMLLSVALLIAQRLPSERRSGFILLGCGFAALAVADSAFAYLTADGTYSTGNLLDSAWLAGFLLIGLAAVKPPARVLGAPRDQFVDRHAVVASVVIAPAAGIVIWQAHHGDLVRAGLAGVLALIVLGRQIMTGRENNMLMCQQAEYVRELQQREIELARRANHDELTGLPNRAALVDAIHRVLEKQAWERASVALLFLDLDHFKMINDSYGHPTGDRVLVECARRLAAAARTEDTVARFGGDEFVIICDNVRDASVATHIAGRLLDALREPVVVDGRKFHVDASIGVALSSDNNAENLLRDADTALFDAKQQGRARVAVSTGALRHRAERHMYLAEALTTALHNNDFVLHYQPIIDISDERVVAVEALLRWELDGRAIPPSEFIAVAEASGSIVAIGTWVLQQATRDAAAWMAQGIRVGVSVNVSALQLRDELVDHVSDALAASGLPGRRLCLEITETALMADLDTSIAVMRRLTRLGVRLAIDDFGTGMSSLSYLKRLPVDVIKIDRSFVRGVGRDHGDSRIVAAVVALAGAAGLRVVAEGVEHFHQAEMLNELGCTHAQGFHYAPPMPATAVAAILASRDTKTSAPTTEAADKTTVEV